MGNVRQTMIEIPLPELRENLAACLSVQRWIDDIVLAAPFDDVAELLAAAYDAGPPPRVGGSGGGHRPTTRPHR